MDPSRRECSIYIWTKHPLVKYALQEALRSERVSVDCFEAHNIPVLFADRMLNVLIVDTCSVVGWRSAAAQWHESGGRVIILVPEDWGGKGSELQALAAGIWGIVPISENFARELSEAVCSILNGRIWLKRNSVSSFGKSPEAPVGCAKHAPLFTRREEQVLEPLLSGVPNKIIAVKLRLSERTVKYHVSHILRKLRVTSRKELFVGNGLQYLAFAGFPEKSIADRAAEMPFRGQEQKLSIRRSDPISMSRLSGTPGVVTRFPTDGDRTAAKVSFREKL